ncbi:MAG: hypothetical protein LH609_19565 [Rudanella sp.]|nr:hypothetical protein [Rudanella sp.]
MHLFSITRVLPALLLLVSLSGFAQKVDLDRFYFEVSYLTLPREFVEPAGRTYGVRVNVAPAVIKLMPPIDVYNQIQLSGFRKVENNPTVGATISFNAVRFEKSETKTRTEERKDREGKVVETITYYANELTYSASGGYQITGPRDNTRNEQRKEEKKQTEVSSNRFLQNANLSSENTGRQVDSGIFPYTMTQRTKEFRNLADLNRYVYENKESIMIELLAGYVQNGINTVNQNLNRWYGYVPYTGRDFVWILDSKSHPEYPVQQEAIKAIKELGKQMSATESLDRLEQNLQPVLAYFQDLKTKFSGSDKREQKIRYSAFYNLANLYYLLDRPDQAIEEANGLIRNGYDPKDGEHFLEQADQLKKDLAKHKLETRHMAL